MYRAGATVRNQLASLENLEYATQKPEALLRRIVETSSNRGDLVADFFAAQGRHSPWPNNWGASGLAAI
jgi:adenine-specific DNA-methyltransferase